MKSKSFAISLFWILSISIVIGCQKQPALALVEVNPQNISDIVDSLSQEKPIFLNLWATWCAPCVEEFDDIVALEMHFDDKVAVYFISADLKKEKAVNYLHKKNIVGWSGFKTGKDEEFINALSVDWSGALPFSQIIYKGEVLDQWEDKMETEELHSRVRKALDTLN